MRAYASRTGTRENLDALRAAGWGLMISARGVHRDEDFSDIVLDNGAWTSFQGGEEFDFVAFGDLLYKFGAKARWIVAPDFVGGGIVSLRFSVRWLPYCLDRCRGAMIAVQDGMAPEDVAPYVGGRVGVFVGGSDDFKVGPQLDEFAKMARARGAELHVGRVNSVRRLDRCRDVGANSFDGSGPSRFRKHLERMQRGRDQGHLWGGY